MQAFHHHVLRRPSGVPQRNARRAFVCRPAAVTSVQATQAALAPVSESSLAGGTLHVMKIPFQLGDRHEERTVRIWCPPEAGPSDPAPPGGWPVLILNDGQVCSRFLCIWPDCQC